MGSILDEIIATKRGEVSAAKSGRPVSELMNAIARGSPARDFYQAVIRAAQKPALIAEIKKASPSAGLIRADFDPVNIARIYEREGAAALSVLTDHAYFQGELEFIRRVKEAVALPVLRKDFVIDEYQLYESRAAGADAILLIAAALSIEQIDALSQLAHSLSMTSLIEVHEEAEVRGVLPIINPQRRIILGINNRNLHAQLVDLETTRRLSELLPAGTVFVAESGIKTHADVQAMATCGAAALLMGEVFMREQDIASKMRELIRA